MGTSTFEPGSVRGITRINAGTYVGDFDSIRTKLSATAYHVEIELAASGVVTQSCGWKPTQRLLLTAIVNAEGSVRSLGDIRATAIAERDLCAPGAREYRTVTFKFIQP